LIRQLLLPLLAGLLSLALTPAVRGYALRNDVLDRPNDRSSHRVATPRGGGLAILVAVLITIGMAMANGSVSLRLGGTLAGGMAALGIIGWLDDTRSLPARYRLVAHFGIAIVAMVLLGGLPSVRLGDHTISLGAFGRVVGAIGIVWSINLFNFMDGIDGIAGAEATLVLGIGSALSFWSGDVVLGVLAAIIAAASAGFLVWNWPPAKIFMGDVGSGSIGYALAVVAVASENRGAVPIIAFAMLGGVFIVDATVTLIRRFRRGHQLSEAHRDHAYQRLTRAWGRHAPVTIATAVLTGLLGALATVGTMHPKLMLASIGGAAVLLTGAMIAVDRRAPS
jgi:Fuc2NAc and GlcNAc transferase